MNTETNLMIAFLFSVLQFLNVVGSAFLIIAGCFLASFIKRILPEMGQYIKFVIILHFFASFLVLFGNELHSSSILKNGLLVPFLHQGAVTTLILINAFTQFWIYRFFHLNSCEECAVKDILGAFHFGKALKSNCHCINKESRNAGPDELPSP